MLLSRLLWSLMILLFLSFHISFHKYLFLLYPQWWISIINNCSYSRFSWFFGGGSFSSPSLLSSASSTEPFNASEFKQNMNRTMELLNMMNCRFACVRYQLINMRMNRYFKVWKYTRKKTDHSQSPYKDVRQKIWKYFHRSDRQKQRWLKTLSQLVSLVTGESFFILLRLMIVLIVLMHIWIGYIHT